MILRLLSLIKRSFASRNLTVDTRQRNVAIDMFYREKYAIKARDYREWKLAAKQLSILLDVRIEELFKDGKHIWHVYPYIVLDRYARRIESSSFVYDPNKILSYYEFCNLFLTTERAIKLHGYERLL